MTTNANTKSINSDKLSGASASEVFAESKGDIGIFSSGTSGHGNSGGNGGGQGGGSHGNEGVGNGLDAPPPGHDYNFNDGPGTSPGNPGAKGGHGYVPAEAALFVHAVELSGVEAPGLVGIAASLSDI